MNSILFVSVFFAFAGLSTADELTWYNDAGFGACGTQIDASSETLAAISHTQWTTANPNNDPLCGKCVSVTYEGKTLV